MVTFEVQDMSCNHCVASITRAVQAVDVNAHLQFDLAQHRVQIDAPAAETAALATAIQEAGYTPVAVDGAAA